MAANTCFKADRTCNAGLGVCRASCFPTHPAAELSACSPWSSSLCTHDCWAGHLHAAALHACRMGSAAVAELLNLDAEGGIADG